jgi:hypothetical protein
MTAIASRQDRDNGHRIVTPIGLAALMRMASTGDLEPLKRQVQAQLAAHPDDAAALMDLSTILQLTGDRAGGLARQAAALEHQRLYRRPPSDGCTPSLRLLAFLGPGDLMANTPVELLVADSDVTLDMYYLVPGLPVSEALPEHDVAFVALGEADAHRPLLRTLAWLTREWTHPVLNAPERIGRLSRELVWTTLAGAPGVVIPMTARVDRQTLVQISSGAIRLASVLERGQFPLVVRPVSSPAGHGVARLDDVDAIAAYLQARPESQFHVSPFAHHCGADGFFRTYRVLFVADHPLAAHMTMSRSGTTGDPDTDPSPDVDTRAEEARFLDGFDADFAARHRTAFRLVTERLGLDYFGIDCGETPDGELVIFEVSTTMLVRALDRPRVCPCDEPQIRTVSKAFRGMLRASSRASPPVGGSLCV